MKNVYYCDSGTLSIDHLRISLLTNEKLKLRQEVSEQFLYLTASKFILFCLIRQIFLAYDYKHTPSAVAKDDGRSKTPLPIPHLNFFGNRQITA